MSKKFILIFLIFAFYFLIFNFVFAQQNPYSCAEPHPTLRLSSRGDCVKHLQWYLNILEPNLNTDGIFGSNTEAVVKDFQSQNNLQADGIAGSITWRSLHNFIAQHTGQQPQPPTQQLPGYSLPPLPPGFGPAPGTGLTTGIIGGLLIRFANFLIAAGIILAIITIVISGIMYFKAGSDTEAKNAKGWFRNGIIGAFIILAVGVIILTIYNIVVTGTFFGGGIPGPAPGPVAPPLGGVPWGSSCHEDIECQAGLVCKPIGIFRTGQKTCQQP